MKVRARVMNLPVPGALCAWAITLWTLHNYEVSLWWFLGIQIALAIMVYAAYFLQHPSLGSFGEVFQELVGTDCDHPDGFDLFQAAFNPARLAPLWHTPTAYLIAFVGVPTMLVIWAVKRTEGVQ